MFNYLVYVVEFCHAFLWGVAHIDYGKGRFGVRRSHHWAANMAYYTTLRGLLDLYKEE